MVRYAVAFFAVGSAARLSLRCGHRSVLPSLDEWRGRTAARQRICHRAATTIVLLGRGGDGGASTARSRTLLARADPARQRRCVRRVADVAPLARAARRNVRLRRCGRLADAAQAVCAASPVRHGTHAWATRGFARRAARIHA
eukprot:3172022-Pleurochrysis_carterae.AAC.6